MHNNKNALSFVLLLFDLLKTPIATREGFPGSASGKEPNVGDLRDAASIFALGRSLGGRPFNPMQYSCLENPMDKGAGRLQSIRLERVGHN